jgi:hypothetical protein
MSWANSRRAFQRQCITKVTRGYAMGLHLNIPEMGGFCKRGGLTAR